MIKAQEQAIRRHGEQLQEIFPKALSMDAAKLYKKLRALEVRAHRVAEQRCNGEILDVAVDSQLQPIEEAVARLLGRDVPIRFNSDPQSYALKIPETCMREYGLKLHHGTDGFGIIAPEIDESGWLFSNNKFSRDAR